MIHSLFNLREARFDRIGVGKKFVSCLLAGLMLVVACMIELPNAYAKDPVQEALIITIPFTAKGKEGNDEIERLYKMEGELIKAIEHSRVGEYDGNEIGDATFTMYAYGPSADKLLEVARPVLVKHELPTGTYAVKRYGKPGAKQERVPLTGAATTGGTATQ